jgi:hypothetical protein
MQNKVVVYLIIDRQCHWLSDDRKLDYKSYINKYSIGHDWLAGLHCYLQQTGHISSEKLSEENAKRLLHTHVGGPQNCTTGHIKLMKVRA